MVEISKSRVHKLGLKTDGIFSIDCILTINLWQTTDKFFTYLYFNGFTCILNISQTGNEKAHHSILYQELN